MSKRNYNDEYSLIGRMFLFELILLHSASFYFAILNVTFTDSQVARGIFVCILTASICIIHVCRHQQSTASLCGVWRVLITDHLLRMSSTTASGIRMSLTSMAPNIPTTSLTSWTGEPRELSPESKIRSEVMEVGLAQMEKS